MPAGRAHSVRIGRTAIGEYIRRSAVIGITWPVPARRCGAGTQAVLAGRLSSTATSVVAATTIDLEHGGLMLIKHTHEHLTASGPASKSRSRQAQHLVPSEMT